MVKAVVLDIDGVIVGTKKGINFPHPDKEVSKALRKVHDSGIPVVFLTAKASFAAAENIKLVGIDNPHIADAGAVLFNPIQGKIFHVKSIKSSDVYRLISILGDDKYINLFTVKDYFLINKMKNKFPDFFVKYSDFMQRSPNLVENFDNIIKIEPILRINVVAFSRQEKNEITKLISQAGSSFIYRWVTNPHLAPIQIAVTTAKGVSKRSGVETLAKDLKVSSKDILGVGDMLQDWDFLQVCGYKATLVNGSRELKNKFNFSDKKQFMGKHVDEDGILDVLKYFKLL